MAEKLGQNRWFHRGWTLQELLAPLRMKFFWSDWSQVTEKRFDIDRSVMRSAGTMSRLLAMAAGVDAESLYCYKPSPAHARRVFGWISRRNTTRPEDIAYCLLGLLDVQLPTAYGEGRERAFYRVQVECSQQTGNRDLFIWTTEGSTKRSRWNSMFSNEPSACPEEFMLPNESFRTNRIFHDKGNDIDSSFTLTNRGLRISLILLSIRSEGCRLISEHVDHLFGHDVSLEVPSIVGVVQFHLCPSFDTGVNDELYGNLKIGILGTFTKKLQWSMGWGKSEWELDLDVSDDDSPPEEPLRHGGIPAFVILLKRVSKASPRYVRLGCKRVYCPASVLLQKPETIFIA
ncbi:hypothetical protein EYR38_007432 [Pleurotus pulmonarius]|nr:hypothetical protein EYR38_007432 [Pleurotus pulmonarius]